MELRIAVPESEVSEAVLNPALETVTRVNERLIASGEVPTFAAAVHKHGLRWHPEPEGQPESFDHAGEIFSRPDRWGVGKWTADCDDLAPYKAASLRASGQDPGAKAIVRRSGPGLWHAIVKRSDGSIDDPSVEAGMKVSGVSGFSGLAGAYHVVGVAPAVVPCMFPPCAKGNPPRPALALNRVVTRSGKVAFDGRCDVPIEGTEHKISASVRRRTASQAIVGAIMGAALVGRCSGVADKEQLRQLAAIAGILAGEAPREVLRVCGESAVVGAIPFVASVASGHNVGFNFGHFLKALEPLMSTAVSFVPGVGPIASKAMDITTDILSKAGPVLQAAIQPPGSQWTHYPGAQMAFDVVIP